MANIARFRKAESTLLYNKDWSKANMVTWECNTSRLSVDIWIWKNSNEFLNFFFYIVLALKLVTIES